MDSDKGITIEAPEALLKANGKVYHVENMTIFALHQGNVLVRMDDDKPRASFLITTPEALDQLARAAKAVALQKHRADLRAKRSAKVIKVRRP